MKRGDGRRRWARRALCAWAALCRSSATTSWRFAAVLHGWFPVALALIHSEPLYLLSFSAAEWRRGGRNDSGRRYVFCRFNETCLARQLRAPAASVLCWQHARSHRCWTRFRTALQPVARRLTNFGDAAFCCLLWASPALPSSSVPPVQASATCCARQTWAAETLCSGTTAAGGGQALPARAAGGRFTRLISFRQSC